MCKACDNLNSQPTKFVNLHVHSCYSLLDGMSKIEDIVDKVKKNKQGAFAITEHGNVFSAVKAHKLAKSNSLKHIYGIEFYVTKDRFVRDASAKYSHLTVLAKNEQGRLNINKLSSLGYIEGFYSKPRVDHELLKKYSEGLIVLSGCMASELQKALAGGKIGNEKVEITSKNIEDAKNVARFYQSIFGNDYYLEIQSHSDERQQLLNRAIVDIAKELNIPFVVTSDSHYVDKEDFDLHGIFIQIGQNREAGETYLDAQLQSEHEVRELLGITLTESEIDEAIRNTAVIADKCNVHLPLSAPIIPHVNVPKEFKSEAEYLKHLCNVGWIRRGINKKPNVDKYKERLLFEFDAITKMGFEGYYLLVESYANSVKRRGVARGSSGGSLVAYLINIVDIDPIEYGLYFERFIDVGALDLLEQGIITKKELKIPDVDLDFGRDDRDVVIQSIIDKYGADRFVSLGQFGVIWDKTAIKDIGKVLGIPFEITNQITKELESDSIKEAIESGKIKKYVEKYPKLFEYASKISGLPKSFGVHPCGKAITINELTTYTAVAKNDDTIVFQGDMHDVEDLGVVKIDALGLKTVDVIYDTLDMIGKDYNYIAPQYLNFKDENVLKLFSEGHTEGIFQFESNGMKNTLKKMVPNGLDDLGVANALFRPGSMKFIDNYVNRKHGKEKVEYLHKDLEPILNITYGILVYQEQLVEIGRLAKMRNPDLLRKATGKKDVKLLKKVKPELFDGLRNRGWDDETIEELWNVMLDFAKYSFNKSHSYAYAITAYITGFLKTYHPKEFICSLLNSYIEGGGQDKYEHIERIINEAKRMKIDLRLPKQLSESNDKCYIDNNTIIYGLNLIKNLNAQVAEELYQLSQQKEYDKNDFVSLLVDIFETSINTKQMEILIRLDYFKEFGAKEALLEIYHCMTGKKKPDTQLYPDFADKTVITTKQNKKTGEIKEDKKVVKRPLKYDSKHNEKTRAQRLENLHAYEEAVKANPPSKIEIGEQLTFEKENLGYAYTTYPNLPNNLAVIIDINKKYTPVLTVYKLKTGEEINIKVSKKKFYTETDQTLYVGDVIQILEVEQKAGWKKEGDKWVRNEDKQDLFLQKVKIIHKSKLRNAD